MTARDERLALDANILVYSVDAKAGEKRRRARKILERLAGSGTVIALQALAEFYASVTRKSIVQGPYAAARIVEWRQLFAVVAADGDTLTAAIEAVSRNRMPFWDAMMWATIRTAGATVLLTEDLQDGAVIGGVQFRNPFAGPAFPPDVVALMK